MLFHGCIEASRMGWRQVLPLQRRRQINIWRYLPFRVPTVMRPS